MVRESQGNSMLLARLDNNDLYTYIFFIVFLSIGCTNIACRRGCPRGVMVKVADCGIVSEFVLQSCYYVHFRTNTLGKGMNPLILPSMG